MKNKWRPVLYILLAATAVILYQSGILEEKINSWAKKRALILAQVESHAFENSWLGIRVQQFPEDLITYQSLIYKIKPDVVVETGTFYGGSAVYFATVLREVNPDGRVITVDITDEYWQKTVSAGLIPEDLAHRIEFIRGDSTSAEVSSKIRQECAGKRVLVFLDSLHTKEHVLKELEAYSPLVQKGSYIIVSDTHQDLIYYTHSGKGPMAAVENFLARTEDFEADKSLPPFFFSASPSGFLKRK